MQQLLRFAARCSAIVFFLCTMRTAHGQVTYTAIDVQIDTAVHHYNALGAFVKTLRTATVTASQLDQVYAQSNAIAAEFSAILQTATGQQKIVAEYFYNLSIYQSGFAYGVAGKMGDSYRQMRRIERYMTSQSTADFPKKYLFEGKNYSIKWENFAPTQMEFFSTMAELSYDQKKYTEVYDWVRKALAVEYTSADPTTRNWNVYVVYTKYIDASNALGTLPDDAMETAIAFLQTYSTLNATYKKTIDDNNYKTHRSGFQFLMRIRESRPELADGNAWYRAAMALRACDDDGNAATCFQYAIDAKYSDYLFFADVYQHARETSNNTLGLNACAWEEQLIGEDDCEGWRTMATNWRSFGNTQKADAATAKAVGCEQRAADKQAEWEKQQRKQQRIEERNFSVYAGIYPIPLLTLDNDYRDYGGVVGFGIGKVGIQGSYKMINRNLVVFDDLFWSEVDNPEERILWDGYRAHLALKFGERDGADESFFVGPLVEVVQKTYTPFKSTVFDGDNMSYLTDAIFQPKETSYNLYLNYGAHIEENHFMFEYFFGIGVTNSTFDLGNDLFNRDDHAFSNTALEFRKPERWGPILRLGITMGLSSRD